jgi:hypothetical protein
MSTESAVPDEVTRRYEHLAGVTAAAWAQRILADQTATPEEQTVAAVVLDLRARVPELTARLAGAERQARNLGNDMLYALQTAYVDEPKDPARALLYLARGWRREGENIAAATCTEGRAVTAALPDTSSVE